MTREAAKEFIAQSVKSDVDIALVADAIKALEQEPVIDKIRAEIEQITDTMGVSYNQYISKIDVLQILDKYKAENNS